MATRMQQRRGTAAQWISTDSGSGPILAAGEIGYESDTNKFKIGDGVNHWLALDYFMDADSTVNPQFGSSIKFEGATANDFETTLQVTDPTADRTVTFQDATGTVVLRDSTDTLTNKSISLGSNTVTSTLAQLNTAVTDADVASLTGTETLTNKKLSDSTTTIVDVSDATKAIKFDVGGTTSVTGTIATAFTTARTLTLPDATGTIAITTDISDAISNAAAAQDSDDITEGTLNLFYTTARSSLNAPLAGPTFTGTVTLPSTTAIGDVSSTEIGYVNGVTSAIQTQLDAKASLSGATFTGAVSGTSLTLSGDLTVNGTTTTINSTTLAVDDKNIVLGDVTTPTDTTADGGGITLKGATDKTFNWVDATDSWTSSEHVNLASGKTLKYNGTDLVASQSGNSGKYLTTDGTSTSWGTVSGYSAPTLGSTSIASGATVSTIAGLTLTSPALTTPTISTLTTAGDLLYGSGSGVLTRLGIGSSTQVLTVVGGVPAWAAGGSAADDDQPILASQIFG